MPVCNDPSCACNQPAPEPSELDRAVCWWENATQEERAVFMYRLGATIKEVHYGIDKARKASVYL